MRASQHRWSFGVTGETWSGPLAVETNASVWVVSPAKAHSRSTMDLSFDEVVSAEHGERGKLFSDVAMCKIIPVHHRLTVENTLPSSSSPSQQHGIFPSWNSGRRIPQQSEEEVMTQEGVIAQLAVKPQQRMTRVRDIQDTPPFGGAFQSSLHCSIRRGRLYVAFVMSRADLWMDCGDNGGPGREDTSSNT
ncbi:unnamed protein product [Pleuronectes platessa]|uniref:Uncharacterized protein n=1 Tax=Pleuronectes platessa TaxID=8262 RepID=A0A9N7Z316_PLEPL|nr:unnamed protein product [Pleuronectes platessa]